MNLKNQTLATLLFAFVLAVFSNQAVLAQDDGPNIYPGLAAGLIEQGVLVVDVRSAEEIQETGVLANASAIPHTQLDDIIALIGERTDRSVVMYCGSGRRVGLVIDQLRERGYGGGVNAGGYADLAATLSGVQ